MVYSGGVIALPYFQVHEAGGHAAGTSVRDFLGGGETSRRVSKHQGALQPGVLRLIKTIFPPPLMFGITNDTICLRE